MKLCLVTPLSKKLERCRDANLLDLLKKLDKIVANKDEEISRFRNYSQNFKTKFFNENPFLFRKLNFPYFFYLSSSSTFIHENQVLNFD
jgi:hypothetical protein